MEYLTKKQESFYQSIKKYIKENKISPTVRELAKINNLSSPGTAHDYIAKLRDKGYITYIEHSGRSIRIKRKGKTWDIIEVF